MLHECVCKQSECQMRSSEIRDEQSPSVMLLRKELISYLDAVNMFTSDSLHIIETVTVCFCFSQR